MAECVMGICDGNGWKPFQDGNVTRMARCECWQQRSQRAAANVPDFFAKARLENFEEHRGNKGALKAARAWLKADAGDLYLVGAVGTGKTRLACSLLNERYAAGDRSAYFCDVSYFMLLKVQSFGDDEKKGEANRIFDRCMEAATVVLDDVGGGEKGSDFSRNTLTTLYKQRLAHSRRTIWTSNLSLAGLAEFYGDPRLPSRISEACGYEAVELAGDDWRLSGGRR